MYKREVESLGFKSQNRIRKLCIREEMFNIMVEMRQEKKLKKEKGRKKYRRLNNELRRMNERE